MTSDSDNNVEYKKTSALRTWIKRLFLDKKFLYYTLIGLFISALNVFALWLLIDVFEIPTVISSIVVIGTTFILRYVLFDFFKVL